MAQSLNYPISASDVAGPTGYRGVVDYASQNPVYVLELAAATLTLTHGQAVGDKASGAFAAARIPSFISSSAKTAHSAGKVVLAVGTCSWEEAASSTFQLSKDAAFTGYNAHCVTTFARSMGATSVPSITTFGISCLLYFIANEFYSNLRTVFDQNVYSGTEAQKYLYERNVSKNWWDLGDNAVTLIYCVLFLLGVSISAGWGFMIALAGVIFTFGSYLEKSEMQHYGMQRALLPSGNRAAAN